MHNDFRFKRKGGKRPMNRKRQPQGQAGMRRRLPVVRAEDVVFDLETADADDLEALRRAEAADARVTARAARPNEGGPGGDPD
jgi:hypothetical protein